jgi:hypothetical protein
MENIKPPLVAVCSYSDEPGDGVFSYRFGLKDGSLNRLDAATARNAAFLCPVSN